MTDVVINPKEDLKFLKSITLSNNLDDNTKTKLYTIKKDIAYKI